MTRKHFERLAWIAGKIEDRSTRAQVVADMIIMATDENTRFDAIRFADAVAKFHEEHYGK